MKRSHQNTLQGPGIKSQRYSAGAIHLSYASQLTESKRHEYFSHKALTRNSFGEGSAPEQLTDLAAKVCALTLPYEAVESASNPVPEPVMKKLIFWSFPRSEAHIKCYSSICYCEAEKKECAGHHFEKGVSMVETEKVKDVLQIGFCLMGEVEIEGTETGSKKRCQVSMLFDRCKITSTTCGCNDNNGMFFCSHAAALAIFRIRKPHLVTFRPPISDTLQNLDRNQLQMLIQHIIGQHIQILPSTHKVTELLLNSKSDLNTMDGAPDPTAGAGLADDDRWALDVNKIRLHVKNLLRSDEILVEIPGKVEILLKKVRDMMHLRDRNGPYLLTLITDELLTHFFTLLTHNGPFIAGWSSVWEKIGDLWICAVLNPGRENSQFLESSLNESESRLAAVEFLETDQRLMFAQLDQQDHSIFSFAIQLNSIKWDDEKVCDIFRHSSPVCKAAENFESDTTLFQRNVASSWRDSSTSLVSEDVTEGLNDLSERLKNRPFTSSVFTTEGDVEKPIDLSRSRNKLLWSTGSNMTLDIKSDTTIYHEDDFLLWHEPLHLAIARVKALVGNGYQREAKVLAFSIACTIKHNYATCFLTNLRWNSNADKLSSVSVIKDCKHPFQSIEVLVDILTDVENVQENSAKTDNEMCNYKSLAFEIILLSLTDRKYITCDTDGHLILLKRGVLAESALIDRLNKFQMNYYMEQVMENVSYTLLLEISAEKNFLPFCRFATYLFENMKNRNTQLAFRIAKHALECPLSHNFFTLTDFERESMAEQLWRIFVRPESFVKNRMERDACDLAINIFKSARDSSVEFPGMQEILECISQNIKNANHLLQLSQEVYKIAKNIDSVQDMQMLNAAVELCKRTLILTIDRAISWSSLREDAIRFLVICTAESGFESIVSILELWCQLFTPKEAVTIVAECVLSSSTAEKHDSNSEQEDKLHKHVCQIAVKACEKNPESCAVLCLKLCKKWPSLFNNAYEVVVKAASDNRMTACELYDIAMFLKEWDFADRALTVGFAATCCLDIGINDEKPLSKFGLIWTIKLCLKKPNLMKDMLKAVCENVKSPLILAKVLKNCISPEDSDETTNIDENSTLRFRADSPVLQPLVEATVSAFTESIHEKMGSLTPCHYKAFVLFLKKAQETFKIALNGQERFEEIISHLATVHKRKKKLVRLMHQEFDE